MSTTIGELVASGAMVMSDGYRTKRSEHGRPGYRILRVADVADGQVHPEGTDFVAERYRGSIGSKLSQAGDVLLTTKGTVGRVAIMPELDEELAYSPQLCFFRVMDESRLNARWLSYWFKSGSFLRQASHRKDNTDMAAYINLADIRSLTLPSTSIDEQREIAEVLGALDDKIAANVRAHKAASQLAVALAASSPAEVALGDVVDVVRGTINPISLGEEMVSHFSLPAFDNGDGPEVTPARAIKSNKTPVTGNTVLISKLNPRFPRIWDVLDTGSRIGLASTEFVAVASRDISSSVLWAGLSDPRFSAALEAKVAGTSGSHQRVKPVDLLATRIADPRQLEGDRVQQVTTLGQTREALSDETRKLVATRDSLLPLLLSGRVRVKDAESAVGEVL